MIAQFFQTDKNKKAPYKKKKELNSEITVVIKIFSLRCGLSYLRCS